MGTSTRISGLVCVYVCMCVYVYVYVCVYVCMCVYVCVDQPSSGRGSYQCSLYRYVCVCVCVYVCVYVCVDQPSSGRGGHLCALHRYIYTYVTIKYILKYVFNPIIFYYKNVSIKPQKKPLNPIKPPLSTVFICYHDFHCLPPLPPHPTGTAASNTVF
jgi:hypothetical protein